MTFQANYIIEDAAAHGATLGFPGASTCVVVVANFPAELVGWHVTVGTLARLASNVAMERRKSAQGLQKFVDYVGGRNGDFFIVGHTQGHNRSEEHTSELQSLMRSSYAVFCLKKKQR